MLIKLTNANQDDKHFKKAILLNTDSMVSVYPASDTIKLINTTIQSLIFCPPHGTWQVKETVDEIFEMISR